MAGQETRREWPVAAISRSRCRLRVRGGQFSGIRARRQVRNGRMAKARSNLAPVLGADGTAGRERDGGLADLV